jgi:hypothetical protein
MSAELLTTKGTIDQFLTGIRSRMNKEAAEDTSVSHMDTEDAKPENQATPKPGHTEQKNLGKEQTADAHDGNATADSVAPNSEEDGKDYADTAGINTLDTDAKVVDKGNIGPLRHQAITQEQKMARANRLADSVLTVLERSFQKRAESYSDSEDCNSESETASERNEQMPVPSEGEHGDDYVNNVSTEEEKEAAAQFDKIASVAQNAASTYYEGFILGMLKRAQDEAHLRQAGLPSHVLEKVGGVEGLLDKVAMEDPMAVLPEEAMGADPAAAAAPAGPMGGGGEDLDAIAGELDAAGVAPEDLEAAIADIQELQAAGVPEEEIIQALGELEAEGGGAPAEAAPEEAAAAAAPEAPVEEKEASVRRARVDQIKAYLRG